eukprot:TRINITY_DN4045_c0_g5_i4.p1 TRINITY_DN4045_c0_g5~~TRINITY_DN4045_c0_g5_i4.p1  ORF type:complete len:486 (-),score=62.14 TRINITY_DN4045_c0_g5_i4:1422-2879(-)
MPNVGSLQIFYRYSSQTGTFPILSEIFSPVQEPEQFFGQSVCLTTTVWNNQSVNLIVVGAPGAKKTGAVYIFIQNFRKEWILHKTLVPKDKSIVGFGTHVAVDEGIIVISTVYAGPEGGGNNTHVAVGTKPTLFFSLLCDPFSIEPFCEDIDECALKIDDCEQLCHNNKEGWHCSCYPGYQWSSKHCIDINECEDGSNSCSRFPERQCINTIPFYKCGDCAPGYRQKGFYDCTGLICASNYRLDEKTGACFGFGGTCSWVNNSWSCNCETGFTTAEGMGYCEDKDECKNSNPISPCGPDSICVNLVPNYTCNCKTGYEMVQTTCRDIDECAQKKADCMQQCINIGGGYTCGCFIGFIVAPDNRSCCSIGYELDPNASNISDPCIPIKCKYYAWSPWSTCTSCNGGFRYRTREINFQASKGSLECKNYAASNQTDGCFIPCVIDLVGQHIIGALQTAFLVSNYLEETIKETVPGLYFLNVTIIDEN